MYSPVQLAARYVRYYLAASNGKGHGIHSPFVFEFITQVMNDDRQFYAYRQIENLREILLLNRQELVIEDLGAGSGMKKSNTRKVADIARSSVRSRKIGQLLFRIVDHYRPRQVLELGISLGITTAYLASADTNNHVVTMEAASSVASVARNNFDKLGLQHIDLIEGNFDTTLATTLNRMGRIDMAFIDGNHCYEPTVRYFRELLPHVHEHSILIFGDIHRSRDMEQAWKEISQDAAVTLSIDLFAIGLVFFRKEQKVKQHFTIRF